MRHSFTAALLAFAATTAVWADPVEGRLPVYCDKHTGTVFISGDPDARPAKPEQYDKQIVNWASLLKMGPQKNQWGDRLRSGSRTLHQRCGPITISFSSGFLNTNPQGELGALDFPVIEVRKGTKVLLNKTAMEQCSVGLSRYTYFGSCPDSWAQRIEVVPAGDGHEVQVRRVFSDELDKDVEKMDVYR